MSTTEPEDCSAAVETEQGCGSGGLVRVVGGTLRTRGNASFTLGKAAKQGGAVYVGSNSVFHMEGPTKFQDNEVTEAASAGYGDELSSVEETWLDAAVRAATGGVEIFEMQDSTNDLAKKFPGQLHVTSDGVVKITVPKS